MGNTSEAGNYRSISIIHIVAKIFLAVHVVISSSQFVYRTVSSTVTAITNFCLKILDVFENKTLCSTKLYMSKAFDTMGYKENPSSELLLDVYNV